MTRPLSLCALLAALVVGSLQPEAGAAKRYRVAFVADPSEIETDIAWFAGLRRARRELGIEARIVIPPVRTSFTSTFRSLARERYDLIFAEFSYQAQAVVAAARDYPETRFAVADVQAADIGLASWPPNVVGVAFREEEIGFVVGYLAGLAERLRPGADVVGSVGGTKYAPVDRFIAGYRAGTRRANPDIRHLNAYAGSYVDQGSCERVAAGQIAKGAGVVFSVAGYCGLGALNAAKRSGAWGIGVDVDQSHLGPHVLTSAVKRFDLAVYRAIELLIQDRLRTGRDLRFGLREGGVGLGRFSPRVPPGLITRTQLVARQIASGRIRGIPTTIRS